MLMFHYDYIFFLFSYVSSDFCFMYLCFFVVKMSDGLWCLSSLWSVYLLSLKIFIFVSFKINLKIQNKYFFLKRNKTYFSDFDKLEKNLVVLGWYSQVTSTKSYMQIKTQSNPQEKRKMGLEAGRSNLISSLMRSPCASPLREKKLP